MFLLPAMTGAAYGRDFLDCKMPLVHWWFLAISKLVGRDVGRIRFVHHYLTSLPGLIVACFDPWAGLTYIVLIQSGQLLAFHGNVGAVPAGLFLLAMWCGVPWVGVVLIALAVAYEPKLAPSAALLAVLSPGWLPLALSLAAVTGGGLYLLYRLRPVWWGYLWEANVTIPKRMVDRRKAGTIPAWPWWTMNGFAALGPWLALAIFARPDVVYWLPAAAYLGLNLMGRVIRPNHLLPLVPWVALAGGGPVFALALLLADQLAGGLYLGDIWYRFYWGLREANMEAREIGLYLRDKVGSVWVNSFHTAVYVYAGKPPVGGLTEQMEIKDVANERREAWRAAVKSNPPDWIVVGPEPGWAFRPIGYKPVAETGKMIVYRKEG